MLDNVCDRDHLNFVRLITAESEQRPDLSQLFLSKIAKPPIQILTAYFQDCPYLDFADSEAIARIFIGSLIYHMLAEEIFHGKEIIPLEKERLVTNLVALVLNTPTKNLDKVEHS